MWPLESAATGQRVHREVQQCLCTLTPDCRLQRLLGSVLQIGTVFASEEYVCPNAVGVDIGCGAGSNPTLQFNACVCNPRFSTLSRTSLFADT